MQYGNECQLVELEKMKESEIKTLAPGQSISSGGIEARRLKDDTAYYCNLMVHGHRIRRLLGKRSEGLNLARAKQAVVQIKADQHDAETLIKLTGRASRPLSFAEGASEYIERSKTTGGKNIAQKTQQLEDHLIPHLGVLKMCQVTSADVDGYSTSRKAAGAAAGTVCTELAVVKHMYTMLAEWDLIAARKFRVRMPRVSNARTVVMSPIQVEALIEAAKSDQDPYTYLFVVIGTSTGMRHREILRLRYDEVNYDTKRFFIPDAKAGSRQQPFGSKIIPALKHHQSMLGNPNGWLFPNRSAKGHRDLMATQFARTVARAGMDPKIVTPHIMRHTIITQLVQNGTALPAVMKISGHKSIKMLERYTHIGDQFVTDALDAVAQR